MSYLLGIDVGTSGLKSILVNYSGQVIASAYSDYQFDAPLPGYAEQDPDVWWRACKSTIATVLRDSAVHPDQITGISFSGQMHGLVPLDEKGNVVRPAILHCDARSGAQVERVRADISQNEIADLMMNPVFTGFLAISLLWVKENEPDNYRKIRKVFLPKDYLRYKLTGRILSDHSDASATLAYDIRNRRWSEEILTRIGLPRDLFPDCVETIDPVGTVSKEAALETGLSQKTIVVAGGGDQVMQSIGNGLIADGQGSVNIGSSGQVGFQLSAPFLNPELNTNMFCAYDHDRWIMFGATMSAGLCMKWWNKIIRDKDYNSINQGVAAIRPGSGGLLFFPYLNGERTPHINPNISGMLLGINHQTDRYEIARAVMEGVSYSLKDCLDLCLRAGFSPAELVASGGGARSPQWLQILADVFNLPIKVSQSEEQAGLGAAIVAGTGVRVYSTLREGCDAFVRYKDEIYTPNESNRRIYAELHEMYGDAYRRIAPTLEQLTVFGRQTES